MLYKKLGNTETLISAIGQSSFAAGDKKSSNSLTIKKYIDVLHYGIDLGMNFVDTAESYEDGHSEVILGKAITGIREKVFIASKFSPKNNGYTDVLKAAEGSLKRLKTDYIDLFQIHWSNPSIPIEETISAMENLVSDGKVRFIGVCNFSLKELLDCQSVVSQYQLVSNHTEYHIFNALIENDLLPYCNKNQINLLAYGAVDQGNLYFNEFEKDVLINIAKKYSATIIQIIRAWLISHKQVIALTRSMSFKHTRENADSANIQLNNEDIKAIDKLCTKNPVFVDTNEINIRNYDVDSNHKIYTSLHEALENKYNLTPSPLELVEDLQNGNMLRPVTLEPAKDKSNRYKYDLVHGRVRYWAWVINFNGEKPIPALIRKPK